MGQIMKLKSNITVLKLQDFNFKNQNGQTIEGYTITFMGDDMVSHTASIKNEVLELVKKTNLPSVFEGELEPTIKTSQTNQKGQLKFNVHSLKFVKEIKLN